MKSSDAGKLWSLLSTEPFFGAVTGNEAMQQKAGLKAVYLSGCQVAGDADLAGEMYPDQSRRCKAQPKINNSSRPGK